MGFFFLIEILCSQLKKKFPRLHVKAIVVSSIAFTRTIQFMIIDKEC